MTILCKMPNFSKDTSKKKVILCYDNLEVMLKDENKNC